MADRKNHYEVAFESLLRQRGVPYVAVDEAKQALFAKASLKSFDFVVYSTKGPNLLVDVKGRRMDSGTGRSSYQTWVTEQEVDDLLVWKQVFGDGFASILMFIYWVDPPLVADEGVFCCRDRWYRLLGVEISEYRDHMRRRSERWRTVALPAADFRLLARSVDCWL